MKKNGFILGVFFLLGAIFVPAQAFAQVFGIGAMHNIDYGYHRNNKYAAPNMVMHTGLSLGFGQKQMHNIHLLCYICQADNRDDRNKRSYGFKIQYDARVFRWAIKKSQTALYVGVGPEFVYYYQPNIGLKDHHVKEMQFGAVMPIGVSTFLYRVEFFFELPISIGFGYHEHKNDSLRNPYFSSSETETQGFFYINRSFNVGIRYWF